MEINVYLCTRKRKDMIKIPTKWELTSSIHAPVAELVDAPDLGSGVHDVQVRVLSGALFYVKNPKYDRKMKFFIKKIKFFLHN